MTKIAIGQSDAGQVRLDVERLIVSKLLITASSGGGKSWLLRKVLEGVSEKTQTIVIDTEGEFATLREKRDMVLAGPNGEVPAEVRSAGLLCRRLMELNLSAVVDISELPVSKKRDFVSLFCNTMVELPRALWRPCFLCIDETHEFAPEGERSTSTEAVALLCSKGRKRGYCLLSATQRLAKLDKDVAAEHRNQFIGFLNLDVDRKRAADILGFSKDRQAEIRDLSPPGREGEFFGFGPALNHRGITKMRAGAVETTHPEAGHGRLAKPPDPSAKIKGVIGELADLAKKADEEAKTLADAQKQIRELHRQLKLAPKPAADDRAVERAVAAAVAQRNRESGRSVGESARRIELLRKLLESAMKFIVTINAQDFFGKAGENIDQAAVEKSLKAAMAEIGRQLDAKFAGQRKAFEQWRTEGSKLLKAIEKALGDSSVPVQVTVRHNEPFTVKPSPPARVPRPPHVSNGSAQSGDLSNGERRILTAVAQYPDGCSSEQITVLTGYKATSKYEYLRQLRAKGLIEGESTVIATDDGIAALGSDFQPLPTGSELREYWLYRLAGGERKVFEAVLEVYPDSIDHNSLQEASGYKATSTYEYLRCLKARKLVEESNKAIKASDNLF